MLKKTMTYKDYNDVEVTEDFYFALNKAELIEMELRAGKDGFQAMVMKILAEDDREAILDQFKELILSTVGRRSEDGRRFIKNKEIRDEFEQTPAFSDLLVEFYTDSDAAANFIAGVIPGDMEATVNEAIAKQKAEGDKPTETVQLPEKTWRDYTRQQLLEMATDEWDRLTGDIKIQEMPHELLQVAMQRKAQNPQ